MSTSAPASSGKGRLPASLLGDPDGAGLTILPPHDREEGVPAGESQTGPLSPGQAFGPRYRIVKLLGLGGMGAVYQAWDAELGVVVALKVIRPEAAADDPTAARDLERRFKRELLLARQVTHKNVVRIHDIGEIGSIKYITMPFVEGENLATILDRERRLSVPRTLAIARGILSGLSAAHQAGVVHRDLKPANIMVSANDEPLIMDFGIALSTGDATVRQTGNTRAAAARGPAAGLTSSTEIVGTVEYMAPEQARGEPVDQRADIYAFGLILYDALLGRRRRDRAESAIAELRQRLQAPPPPPRSVDDAIPEALDRLVSRCIEPRLDQRYQATQDLVADLDGLDAEGKPLPSQRRFAHLVVAASAALILGMFGVNWWLMKPAPPAAAHAPVTVLIADFGNATGDAAFDHTLEPMLRLGLEGAKFISAYDRTGIKSNLGVRPPEKLDERAALELAVKQGLGVVLSGSVLRSDAGYRVVMKATQAVSGNVIAQVQDTASSRDRVLNVATRLAAKVRQALGDDTSSSSQLFAMESLSATSLGTVREYAGAMEALSNSRFDEALQAYSKIVARDPKFGLGYLGMAVALRNLDRHQEAQRYMQDALRHLDGMTERERLRTRGLAFKWSGDYQACVKEFSDLLGRYSSDAMAHNNLAGCYSYLRQLPKAIDEMRQAVRILPKRNLYRENLALYAAYDGDFLTADREARAMQSPGLFGVLPIAFSQALQGQAAEARQTYERLKAVDGEEGPSYTVSGLGDLAIYEGRFAEAERILEKGALADVAAKNPDRAAAKFAALGHAQSLHGANGPAVAAAQKALANSQAVKIRFLAARIFVEAGDTAKAAPVVASLAGELQAEPQAYAKIVGGEIALKSGNPREAIRTLNEANALFDTWLGHFDLGRAYLDAGALTQADSEFDRCLKRRGEAVSLFLDEEPTYGFFPPVYYYQGRVRQALNSDRFAESYRAYLAIRGASKDDPLAADARRRAGG